MGIPVFLYHAVSKSGIFRSQMEYLAHRHLRAVSVYEFMRSPEAAAAGSVMLTFDDGNMSDFETAFPVLKDFHLTAHFFVSTDFIGRKGHMDWPQVRELQKNGFVVGSHTTSHRDLSRLEDKKVIDELDRSRLVMEDKLGGKVDTVSMPHGGYDKRIHGLAGKSGYKAVFISMPVYEIVDTHPYVFGRFDMTGRGGLGRFRNIVSRKTSTQKSELAAYFGKRFIRKMLPRKMLLKLQENKDCCQKPSRLIL
jgi:peptidoglycan/xylan/chitin deacetylase (PgdA/CDA1 family)